MRISDWSSDVCSSDLPQETLMRPSGRAPDQMRPISIETSFTIHAEGSVLVAFGNTKVLVTASVEEKVPPFLRGKGRGWVPAEYGTLPRATHTRGSREAAKGKQSGRTSSEERSVGKECVSPCRSRWAPHP